MLEHNYPNKAFKVNDTISLNVINEKDNSTLVKEFIIKEIIEDVDYTIYSYDLLMVSNNTYVDLDKTLSLCNSHFIMYYNLYDMNGTKKLISNLDLVNNSIRSIQIFDESEVSLLWYFYDATSNMLKVVIPFLSIFAVVLISFISYYSIRDNKRNFDSLYLMGVSKKTIINMSLMNQIECIILSIIMSILPVIYLNNYLIKDAKSFVNMTIEFNYSLFNFGYYLISILGVSAIIFVISIVVLLLKRNDKTYIN